MSWITPELLDALRMVESSGNNKAVSSAGAVGEYQFMPENVHDMGYGVDKFDPKNPEEARKAAAQYLSGMQEHHGWTPEQTLQAYNWGPGNMKKYLSNSGLDTDITMPDETSNYVGKFSQFGWSPSEKGGIQIAQESVKPIDNIPRVTAGLPSFSFDKIVEMFSDKNTEETKPVSEIKKMATQEAQAYFQDFKTLDSLPSMDSRLMAPMQQLVEEKVIPVNSYSPGVDMNENPKPMYPLAGGLTQEPLDTGPAQFADIETLFNEPRTYVPASGRTDAYSYIDNTIPPHASEFSQAYVAPAGREPAGVAVEQPALTLAQRGVNPNAIYPLQNGTVVDQSGKPVRSGNNNVIGLPTQNAAYAAPAGGKGANATTQSAMDQLTGIKGFGVPTPFGPIGGK